MKENEQKSTSFKEMLLGSTESHRYDELDDWVSDEEDDVDEEEQDLDCPIISLSKEDKKRLRKPWQHTLILKLLGRSIGYNMLLRKIKEMWRPKAEVEIVAIDNGFFLAKFASVDDYEFAKFGGPWLIFYHYLIVRPWQPNFDPTQNTLKNLLVWVRIPCLPIEYFDHSFLMRLKSKIGRPLKIDDTTSTTSRGHNARLCGSRSL